MPDSPTGAVIVGIPAQDDPVRELYQDPNAPMHVTLVYLGQADDLSPEARAALDACCQSHAAAVGPVTADVNGTAQLGDEGAQVLLLQGQELTDLHDSLTHHAAVAPLLQATADQQFPTWIPHTTLSYGGESPNGSTPDQITLDALGLWLGPEQTTYQLKPAGVTAASDPPGLHKDGSPPRCEYCERPSTSYVLHSEGMAYVPACDEHLEQAVSDAERSTPDGEPDPSNVSRVGHYAVTAAITDPDFEAEHPRGADGRFIRKFSVIKYILDGAWAYGMVGDITPAGITVYPSDLHGNVNGPQKTLQPEQIYQAPKPKAFVPVSQSKTAKKVGNQAGSNPGGFYELQAANDAGSMETAKYYVKKAKSVQHGRNEALANHLYDAVGVPVPEVTYDEDEGNIYSRLLPAGGGKEDMGERVANPSDPENAAWLSQIRRNFAVDAWLANWDVFGLTWDNVKTSTIDGQPYRIDNGGALLYRAQGEPKGKDFGSKVGELQAYLSGGKKTKVYGAMTKEEELDGVNRVLALSPGDIKDMVAEHQLPSDVADTLVARRAYLAEYYGLPLPESVQPPDTDVPTSAPTVDPVDTAKSGGLSRRWTTELPLSTASLLLEPGDTVRLPDGTQAVFGLNEFKTADLATGHVQLFSWQQQWPDGKVHVRKLPGELGRPEHGKVYPPDALASYSWQRGDAVTVTGVGTLDGSSKFTVLGINRTTSTALLQPEKEAGKPEPSPLLFALGSAPYDSTWTVQRWNPPVPEVQAHPEQQPVLPEGKPQGPSTGQAAVAAEAIKADLVQPLPNGDGAPPTPADEKASVPVPAPEPVPAPVPVPEAGTGKSMVLGDGTTAEPGAILKSKVDSKPYVYVKKKGPYAVVTDPSSDTPDKQLLKKASTLGQEGVATGSVSVVDIPPTLTKDGNVPALGMLAQAKDGWTGEITMISPDKKFVFITDPSGKRKRKSASQVVILGTKESSAASPITATPAVGPQPNVSADEPFAVLDADEVAVISADAQPEDEGTVGFGIPYGQAASADLPSYMIQPDVELAEAVAGDSLVWVHYADGTWGTEPYAGQPLSAMVTDGYSAAGAGALSDGGLHTVKVAALSGSGSVMVGATVHFQGHKLVCHGVQADGSLILQSTVNQGWYFLPPKDAQGNLLDVQVQEGALSYATPVTLPELTNLLVHPDQGAPSGFDGEARSLYSLLVSQKIQPGTKLSFDGSTWITVNEPAYDVISYTDDQGHSGKFYVPSFSSAVAFVQQPVVKPIQEITPDPVVQGGSTLPKKSAAELVVGDVIELPDGQPGQLVDNPDIDGYAMVFFGKHYADATAKMTQLSGEVGHYGNVMSGEDMTLPGSFAYAVLSEGNQFRIPGHDGDLTVVQDSMYGFYVATEGGSFYYLPSDGDVLNNSEITVLGQKVDVSSLYEALDAAMLNIDSSDVPTFELAPKATVDQATDAGAYAAEVGLVLPDQPYKVVLATLGEGEPTFYAQQLDGSWAPWDNESGGWTTSAALEPGALLDQDAVVTVHEPELVEIPGAPGGFKAQPTQKVYKITQAWYAQTGPDEYRYIMNDGTLNQGFTVTETAMLGGSATPVLMHDPDAVHQQKLAQAAAVEQVQHSLTEPPAGWNVPGTLLESAQANGATVRRFAVDNGTYLYLVQDEDGDWIDRFGEFTTAEEMNGLADAYPFEDWTPATPSTPAVSTWTNGAYVAPPGTKVKKTTTYDETGTKVANIAYWINEPGHGDTWHCLLPGEQYVPSAGIELAAIESLSAGIPQGQPHATTLEDVEVGGPPALAVQVGTEGSVNGYQLADGETGWLLTLQYYGGANKVYLVKKPDGKYYSVTTGPDGAPTQANFVNSEQEIQDLITGGPNSKHTLVPWGDPKQEVPATAATSLSKKTVVLGGDYATVELEPGEILVVTPEEELNPIHQVGPMYVQQGNGSFVYLDKLTGQKKSISTYSSAADFKADWGSDPVPWQKAVYVDADEAPITPSSAALTPPSGMHVTPGHDVPLEGWTDVPASKLLGGSAQAGHWVFLDGGKVMQLTKSPTGYGDQVYLTGNVYETDGFGKLGKDPIKTDSNFPVSGGEEVATTAPVDAAAAAAPAPEPAPTVAPTGLMTGPPAKPSQEDVNAWGGPATKDGYIPTAGMKVAGKGPMTGQIISLSKDKTKATVLTSDGKESVRLVSALTLDTAGYSTVAQVLPSGPVAEGQYLAVDTPSQAIAKVLSSKAHTEAGQLHGFMASGVTDGTVQIRAAKDASGNPVLRAYFRMDKEHYEALAANLTSEVTTKKGAFVSKQVPSNLVKPGDQLAMRLSSSTSKWKPDSGVDAPTHTVSAVTEVEGETGVWDVTLDDGAGNVITSRFHSEPSRTVKVFTWDPDKVAPPKVGAGKPLSDAAKAQGWQKTTGRGVSTVKNGVWQPTVSDLNSSYGSSNAHLYKQKASDGTVIEATVPTGGVRASNGFTAITVSAAPGKDPSASLMAAMDRLGITYRPPGQSELRRQVLINLKMALSYDKSQYSTTHGADPDNLEDPITKKMFAEFGGIVGVPDVGWQDVLVAQDSRGQTTLYWSERVQKALAKKNSKKSLVKVMRLGTPATRNEATLSIITNGTIPGPIRASEGYSSGVSGSADDSRTSSYGGFFSAINNSMLPWGNPLWSSDCRMTVYYHPMTLHRRIVDFRNDDSYDRFGDPPTGTKSLAKMLSGTQQKDVAIMGGLPADEVSFIALSDMKLYNETHAKLKELGITHIYGRPVKDVIIKKSEVSSKSASDLFLPPLPANTKPLLDVPEVTSGLETVPQPEAPAVPVPTPELAEPPVPVPEAEPEMAGIPGIPTDGAVTEDKVYGWYTPDPGKKVVKLHSAKVNVASYYEVDPETDTAREINSNGTMGQAVDTGFLMEVYFTNNKLGYKAYEVKVQPAAVPEPEVAEMEAPPPLLPNPQPWKITKHETVTEKLNGWYIPPQGVDVIKVESPTGGVPTYFTNGSGLWVQLPYNQGADLSFTASTFEELYQKVGSYDLMSTVQVTVKPSFTVDLSNITLGTKLVTPKNGWTRSVLLTKAKAAAAKAGKPLEDMAWLVTDKKGNQFRLRMHEGQYLSSGVPSTAPSTVWMGAYSTYKTPKGQLLMQQIKDDGSTGPWKILHPGPIVDVTPISGGVGATASGKAAA